MKLADENFEDSRARRLYPGYAERGGFYGPCNYQPIIDSFGESVVQVDDKDYQGDTRVLLKKDGRFGFLNFGWGSCSGCDGLQACGSYRELEELIVGLEASIQWFDSLKAAQDYILHDDRKVSYYAHEREWQDFIRQIATAT